jgi:multiple sugar transport system substrate-binding protein
MPMSKVADNTKHTPDCGDEGQAAATAVSPALSRREFLRMAGTAAAGAVLGGCTLLRPEPTPQSPDQVQLVYQDWRTDWFPPMVRQMLEQFHATHPNIRVFYTPDPEDFEEKVLADMQAGTAPDVFQACCSFFPILAQKGYTLDLRPYVEVDLDQATVDDWDPAQYRSFFTRDGQQYGLPKYHGALALYYNRDLFDEYGVDYPDESWDHDGYMAAMERLTDDRDGDGETDLWGSTLDVSWDRIQVHVNSWGGHFVDPDDPAQCRMCEPEAMAAMEWIRARMWDDRVMATPLDVQNVSTRQAFINGQVAMVEDGSWALKDILSGANFRVGVAPFPAGPVRRVTLATTDGFGIYAGTRHPDAAWELLKFLTSREYGRAMARANFLQPARASLVDEWIDFIREEFPGKIADWDIAAFADGHLKGYSVTAEIFANMADAKRLAYAAWDQIYKLGQAPVEEMETVCRQIEEAQEGTE